MSDRKRAKALEVIRKNIQKSGFHIYMVEQHSTPRFAYTIGLSERVGAELVLAGAIAYFGDDVLEILHSIRRSLEAISKRESSSAAMDDRLKQAFVVEGQGTFRLREAHASWSSALLLGAMDYYGVGDISAYQILPDEAHWTVDIPNMMAEWSPTAEPIWRWLREPWPYSFPDTATATTNLAALRGEKVTEVVRWERDEWEMFAGPGPDVTEEEMRVVPISCLVEADPSLDVALNLEIGKGVWRESGDGGWNVWEKST